MLLWLYFIIGFPWGACWHVLFSLMFLLFHALTVNVVHSAFCCLAIDSGGGVL